MPAIVVRMIKGRHIRREGRGFSMGELKQAGISRPHAVALRVMVDRRRSTIHPENVQTLKGLADESKREPNSNAIESPSAVGGSQGASKSRKGAKTRWKAQGKKTRR